MKVRVAQAKTKAIDQLEEYPECRNLFSNLRVTDGAQTINQTRYRQYDQSSQCDAGVPAWTHVNWTVVFVCGPSYSNLSADRRASTIIHEALHSAGKKESPAYPGHPTSAQIEAEVREKCHL